MTDARVTRLYVFAVTLLVFFVVWAVVAARPWVTKSSSSDRQIAALAAREQRIHFESLLVRKLRAQRASAAGRGSRAGAASRHAAAARDHEDVVIEAHAFRAMGTDIELFVRSSNGGATEAFDAVEAEFERLEQIMSRFRPDSELSQLNRAGALEVSADLAHVIALALAARERTAGRFDPCVHDALVAAGYDRTFAEVAPDAADTAQLAADLRRTGRASTAAASSSKTARSSISAASARAMPPSARPTSSPPPGPVSSTPAATSLFAEDTPGRSASRPATES